ncbi:hypothetical protein [Streptomyces antimycoticus]
MPNTPKAEADPQWFVLVEPEEAARRSWNSAPYVTRLVDCEVEWDAIVVAPPERGLAALVRLRL